jgi:hypothetical protein
LLEGTIDWREDMAALVEINGGYSTLADALRSEFKFLDKAKS